MQPVWRTISGLAVILLLVGQGCQATQLGKKNTDVKSKPAMEEKKDNGTKEKNNEAMMKKNECATNTQCLGGVCFEGECLTGPQEDGVMVKQDGTQITPQNLRNAPGELVLQVASAVPGTVQLTWKAPEDLDESNRFIIIRDEMENPEHTGNNSWIRQSHLKRTVLWNNIPTGTMHFRVCLTKDDMKDACSEYSNDVAVEVE